MDVPPLYLSFSPPKYRSRRSLRAIGKTAPIALGLLCLFAGRGLGAQEKPAAPEGAKPAIQTPPTVVPLAPVSPVVNFRERPRFVTDPQRLRRSVQVDGALGEGEWDPFYTIGEGPIQGTIYCNWDDNFLYLAARTSQPSSVIFDVDMSGDGWLRGADNLELVIGGTTEGAAPTVVARLLDAANSKDTPVWNEKAIDVKSLQVAVKTVNGTQVVEVAIPKNTASLVLRPGVNIGLRGEFLPPMSAAAYVPTPPFDPHLLLDASLVESRVVSMAGVNPRLTLSDDKCIAGQTLFATLELLNQTDQAIPIRSLLWTGQGGSANAINTVREVTVPVLPALKTLRLKYRTPLPPTLPTGSYTLVVTGEMENGKQVQATSTFMVVEPLQAQMASSPQPVAIIGQTKLTVSVDVLSAVPDHLRADVELTSVPAGWLLDGGKKRSLYIDREDGRRAMRYTLKLPSTTPAGDYPLEATVSWRGRVWKTHTVARVIRTDSPKTDTPKP